MVCTFNKPKIRYDKNWEKGYKQVKFYSDYRLLIFIETLWFPILSKNLNGLENTAA